MKIFKIIDLKYVYIRIVSLNNTLKITENYLQIVKCSNLKNSKQE